MELYYNLGYKTKKRREKAEKTGKAGKPVNGKW